MSHLHRVLVAALGAGSLLTVQAAAMSLSLDDPAAPTAASAPVVAERRAQGAASSGAAWARVVPSGRGYISSSGVEALSGLPAGTGVTGTAWFRAGSSRQYASVIVRERVGERRVQSQERSIRLPRGEWTAVRTPLTTLEAGSTITMVAVAESSTRTVDVRIGYLDLSVTTPVVEPTPTPDPGGGVLTNGCSYTRRGIPACGAFLGAAYGGNTDPAEMEQQVGGRLGVRRTFYTGSGVSSAVRTATADLAAGRLPWISFKLPYTWEQMAAGAGDAWARDLATRLSVLDGPVWVAFHHEPEGDGDIDAWRRMQERLAPIVRAAAPNVSYSVVLTGWNQFYGNAAYSLENLWPRDTTIDIAGFDLYNEYGVVKDGRTITRWPNFDTEYFAKIQAWADAEGVEWGMAEWAYTDEGHQYDPDWIEKTYDQMVARGGIAAAYFNTDVNAYGSWLLGTASKLGDFASALRDAPALPLE